MRRKHRQMFKVSDCHRVIFIIYVESHHFHMILTGLPFFFFQFRKVTTLTGGVMSQNILKEHEKSIVVYQYLLNIVNTKNTP